MFDVVPLVPWACAGLVILIIAFGIALGGDDDWPS